MPALIVPDFLSFEKDDDKVTNWLCRRDSGFTNPDPSVAQIGDRIHAWTVVDKVTEYASYDSACGGYSEGGVRDYPHYCVPATGYHVPKCHEIEYAYHVFELVCDCGTIKKTRDPFASRKCQHHSRNLYEFQTFCRQLLSLVA